MCQLQTLDYCNKMAKKGFYGGSFSHFLHLCTECYHHHLVVVIVVQFGFNRLGHRTGLEVLIIALHKIALHWILGSLELVVEFSVWVLWLLQLLLSLWWSLSKIPCSLRIQSFCHNPQSDKWSGKKIKKLRFDQ